VLPDDGPLVSRISKTLNVREAAILLGVPESQVRKWIETRAIPAEKQKGRWEIPERALVMMPQHNLQRIVSATVRGAANQMTKENGLIFWWRAITAACIRVHAGEFTNGCTCEVCRLLHEGPHDDPE
jgi:excisionase family DNA binding protein